MPAAGNIQGGRAYAAFLTEIAYFNDVFDSVFEISVKSIFISILIKMLTEIEHGLFLGSQTDAKNASNFDLVINCTPDVPFASDVPETSRIRIPLCDNNEYREQVVLFGSLIDNNILKRIDDVIGRGGKVLVHSFMGIQRSCAVVAAYLMYKKHWDYYTALAYIKTKRPSFEQYVNFHVGLTMLHTYFRKLRNS